MSNTENPIFNAEYIGAPYNSENTDIVHDYTLTALFEIIAGDSAHFAVSARNKDNYTHVEINRKYVAVGEVRDGKENLGGKYYLKYPLEGEIKAQIHISNTAVTVIVNGDTVIDNEILLTEDKLFTPPMTPMMKMGLTQREGEVKVSYIKIESGDGVISRESDFTGVTVFDMLGETKEDALTVKGEFNLINPVPAVNVRKLFTVNSNVKKATLYATARGFYDLYVNGIKVNYTFYNPGFTDYRKRLYYSEFDVTSLIREGTQSLGATVGKGYYTGFCGYSGAEVYGKENTFLAALVLEYENGDEETILTDDSWQFTDMGAVLDADYQQGESYDARYEIDWTKDSEIWQQARVYIYPQFAEPTNGKLKNEPFVLGKEPCGGGVVERVLIPVKSVYERPLNHFVYDLGQNMVGTVRVQMTGVRGKTIKIRYGEMCYRDGKIYNENYRSAANIDTYTMKGGEEVFLPSLTSHGFRYVEISGCGEELTRSEFERLNLRVEGLVITNTTKVTGTFECSNKDINKLYENIMWGQRGNSLLVYTDCPQRNERMGWTGDVQVFCETAAYNMYVKDFMNKFLTDMRDGQLMYNLKGAVPDTAPLGGDNRETGGCSGWGDAAVIVPWTMYCMYGDTKILSDNYDMMKKWADYLLLPENQKGYIQRPQSRGDHLAVDTTTPNTLTATAYAAHSLNLMSQAAAVLGNSADTKKYSMLFDKVRSAFGHKWVKDDGTIEYTPDSGDTKIKGSQTAYALAIDFGLLDGEQLKGAREGLKAALEKYDNKISVGFLGISHIMNALCKVELYEEAFHLLEQTDNPGWLYSVRNGATTIWERWNSYIAETDTFGDVSMNSFNHYAYGAVGAWLYNTVLGINTSSDAGGVGFEKIILTPTVGGSLTYARGSYETKWGIIRSEWERKDGKVKYKCEIPQNTTAVLYLGNKKIPLTAGEYEFVI